MNRNSHADSTSDWIVGAVKKNPEGLLLLAAGAVLLLRKSSALASSPSMKGGQSRTTNSGSGGLSQAVSGAQDFASDIAERTMDTVGSAASTASEYATKAKRAVSAQSDRVIGQAQSTFEGTVNRILKDQPLAIAIAGIAAGAAVAAAFPATEFEKEHLRPLGNEVSEAAQRLGGQLKEAGAKAGEALKNAVDERGLNPDGFKEVASEVASAFGSTMSGDTGGKSGNHSGNAGRQGDRKGG